jgi:hypothetical protein
MSAQVVEDEDYQLRYEIAAGIDVGKESVVVCVRLPPAAGKKHRTSHLQKVPATVPVARTCRRRRRTRHGIRHRRHPPRTADTARTHNETQSVTSVREPESRMREAATPTDGRPGPLRSTGGARSLVPPTFRDVGGRHPIFSASGSALAGVQTGVED